VSESAQPTNRHLWINGPSRGARAQAADSAGPTVVADCHRRLRGPYTGVGTMLRTLIPSLDLADEATRQTLDRHSIEILAVAPELTAVVEPRPDNLTTGASEEERTRWWSRLRTRRIAHGLIDLLRELTADRPPLVLAFDRLDQAEATDQEFVTLALRRLDPQRVRLVIGSGSAASAADLPAALSDDLLVALRAYADSVSASEDPAPTAHHQPPSLGEDPADNARLEELARSYVWSECADEDPHLALAYANAPAGLRARLHDERAGELAALGEYSLLLGAVPYHREHGADPDGAGDKALMEAITYSIGQGYYSAALELSDRQSVRVGPEPFPAYYQAHSKRAQCLAALDRAEECEPIYFDLLSRTTNPVVHTSLYYALGMLYTRLYSTERKDHPRARAYLNTSVVLAERFEDESNRAFVAVFMGNGKALADMHTGNLAGSLALVTGGIDRLNAELAPDQHRLHRSVLHHNRGQVLAGLGRLDEAMTEFDYVVEIDPGYPEYRFDRGSLHLRRGEPAAALADYEAAVRLGPPFPELYYNRGEAHLALGGFEAAVADFGAALDLEPDHLEARISLASLLLTAEEPAQAAQVTRSGLSYLPDSARLHCTLGLALADLEDLDAAARAFDQALRLDPDLREAQINRAVVAYQQERYDLALADLTAVLAADPVNPDLLYNRGAALEALGDWAGAAADYTTALAQDGCDQAELLFRRAHCRTALGQDDQAQADLRSVLALGDSPYDAQVRAALEQSAVV
jgi:tetratricopeptide (TPR) repeat protein